MPKKQPRNAFYFYMIDLREEQKKNGIVYQNMQELATAAGPLWASAPPPIRKKYENRAKAEKEKTNTPAHKFTSSGISYAELEAREREQKEAEEAEIQDIKNFVKLKHFDNSIQKEDIFIMDVNSLCKYKSGYLIGEATILRFSIEEGVKDCYHELINSGVMPIGYASDVKQSCIEFGLEMPDDSSSRSNFIQILANIIDFLKRQDPKCKSLPPIFTMPDKVEQVQDFIHQMCRKAAEDETLFRVYKLDRLYFTLINTIKNKKDEAIPTEALALLQLKKDPFKYSPGLGCQLHEEKEKALECTTSRVKRWAYTVLDKTSAIVGICEPGRHLPADFDVDGILTYKEQKKERPAPSVAGYGNALSSCNSSIVHSTISTSVGSKSGASKPGRVHIPLRPPKKDYTQSLRMAPELTETDFPKLGDFPPLGASRGRGRSLANSLNNMKLNE